MVASKIKDIDRRLQSSRNATNGTLLTNSNYQLRETLDQTPSLQTEEGQSKDSRSWARIWFRSLAFFHNVRSKTEQERWCFTKDDVIAFLIVCKSKKTPAWKRLKIVEGLIVYRRLQGQDSSDLNEIARKLLWLARRVARKEKAGLATQQGITNDVAGDIDPNEADPIRVLRIKLRLSGHKFNTEKAYVKWVRRFLASRRVKELS